MRFKPFNTLSSGLLPSCKYVFDFRKWLQGYNGEMFAEIWQLGENVILLKFFDLFELNRS